MSDFLDNASEVRRFYAAGVHYRSDSTRGLSPGRRELGLPISPLGDSSLPSLPSMTRPISRETRAWLADQPAGRFELTFTPKHGSWLNLVEGFFSKLARSILRHIRVSSKQELKERLMAAVDYFNDDPVVHTTYKLDRAA